MNPGYDPTSGNQMTPEKLQKLFRFSADAYAESIDEAQKTINYYHNRQLTDSQIDTLNQRGQPKETFNIIKAFTRLLIGYFGNIVSTIKVSPQQPQDSEKAAVMNDIINQVFRDNHMETLGDRIKESGILTGLLCIYKRVEDTGEKDEFGNPVLKINLEHVPPLQLLLDPLSTAEDYAQDARFLHRYKWVHVDTLVQMFGKSALDGYDGNATSGVEFADGFLLNDIFTGSFTDREYVLVIHSIVKDHKNDYWQYFWSGNKIFKKFKTTDNLDRFPYRVFKIIQSNIPEYYGIFRDLIETQNAINQAIIKIQLAVNTQKVLVQEGAVKDMAKFIQQLGRIDSVLEVLSLEGVKVENLSGSIKDQYEIIEHGLYRIQRVLGINESFLGIAYASDSGRKVKLQQQASIIALKYLTNGIEQFYRLLAEDCFHLIKQYYSAHQLIRITDKTTGNRWLEVNTPIPNVQNTPNGLTSKPAMFEQLNKDGSPIVDENGVPKMGPLYFPETQIQILRADIEIDTASYNDEDERSLLFLESVLQGPPGVALQQVAPSKFFESLALWMRQHKMRFSGEIAEKFEAVAQQLEQAGNPPIDNKQKDGKQTGERREVLGDKREG